MSRIKSEELNYLWTETKGWRHITAWADLRAWNLLWKISVCFQNTSKCSLLRFSQRQKEKVMLCYNRFFKLVCLYTTASCSPISGCQSRHPTTKSKWRLWKHCSVNGGGKGLALGKSDHKFSSALTSSCVLIHKVPLLLSRVDNLQGRKICLVQNCFPDVKNQLPTSAYTVQRIKSRLLFLNGK